MNNTENILLGFEKISLTEMESVKLMNRIDNKYCFHNSKLEDILEFLKQHYFVLQVEEKRISRYETLYYDTANLDFYKQHHNCKLNRFKIRHRIYVDSKLGFLEVKFKNNKGRSIKKRISKNEISKNWDSNTLQFLNATLPFDASTLQPIIWVNYSRITFVNKTTPERLTIDINFEFKKDNFETTSRNLVVLEVKQENKSKSPFFELAKKLSIKEASISKYCLAIANTNNSIKKNNFKQNLTTISKIANDN